MAKPFFSGNYGSALARVDTRPIMEAGRAQGQMYANLGQQVGGMIQQYGLNKEKQKKNQAFIKGQSNLLGMLEEQDPEQAARYATMKEQLNDPDVSLSERAELGKQLMQNITLTTQLKDQMVNRETKEQALKLANRTEDLTVKNYELGNRQKEIGTLLGQISLDELKAIKDDKTRVALLTLKDREKDLLLNDQRRGFEEATIASKTEVLPLQTTAKKAQLGAVPRQVERQEELGDLQVKAAKRSDDSADLLLEAFGGAKGKAEFDYQGQILSRKNFNKGLKYLDAKINYTKFLSTAKNVPVDIKKKYASLVSHSGKILDTRVEDPETGNPITFEKYMEKANDGDERYPLTGDGSGAAGTLYGNYLSAQKQINDFGKTIPVQVDDGQDAGGSPAPTRSTMPFSQMPPQQAMQTLQDRIGELRRLGPSINAQRQQLGQPGQNMPTPQVPMGGGGFTLGSNQAPQSIDYIQQQGDAITQQEAQRKSDLAAAEAQLLKLQSQFGVR